MTLRTPPSTTEMQVTSIRFERDLIDKLKALAGSQGYQSLVREVLWDYVNQHLEESLFPIAPKITPEQIRIVIAAEARQSERCTLTGSLIKPGEEMWLALTTDNQLMPVSIDGLGETE